MQYGLSWFGKIFVNKSNTCYEAFFGIQHSSPSHVANVTVVMLFEEWFSPIETRSEFGNYWVMLQIRQVQVGPGCLALRVVLGLYKVLMSQMEGSCISLATAHPSN